MNFTILLFLIGILGFILNRKNIILMIIAIEIMLLAVSANLPSFFFQDFSFFFDYIEISNSSFSNIWLRTELYTIKSTIPVVLLFKP